MSWKIAILVIIFHTRVEIERLNKSIYPSYRDDDKIMMAQSFKMCKNDSGFMHYLPFKVT